MRCASHIQYIEKWKRMACLCIGCVNFGFNWDTPSLTHSYAQQRIYSVFFFANGYFLQRKKNGRIFWYSQRQYRTTFGSITCLFLLFQFEFYILFNWIFECKLGPNLFIFRSKSLDPDVLINGLFYGGNSNDSHWIN